jgi:hypothetical protein
VSKLNIEELLGCLQEAAIVVKNIAEKQHINNLSQYFDENNKPIVQTFKIGRKKVNVPLFILADHTSIGLESLEFEFETRLISDTDSDPSEIKKALLGVIKNRGDKKHNIANLTVDSSAQTSIFGKEKKSGMANIKVVFKRDEKPEAVSRLVDNLIQRLDFGSF